jgi:hypothetical protein
MDRSMGNPDARQNRHLHMRCQQRGVSRGDLEALLDAADHLVPVGRGCMAMTLSRHAAAALQADGVAVAVLDRARRRAVVIDDDGAPVTVLVPSRRHGRRYRNGRTGPSWA